MGRKQEKFLCVVCRSSVSILSKDGECDIIRRTFEVDGIIAFFWKGAVDDENKMINFRFASIYRRDKN